MKLDLIKNKLVFDSMGEKIGRVIDVDFKEDGTYTLVVKGELDDLERAKELEKFGVVGETDTFEVPMSIVQAVTDTIILRKEINQIGKDIKVIRKA